MIHLDPIAGTRNIESGNKTANIALGFFEQGGEDTASAELQAIYKRQELASAEFLSMLQEEDGIGDITVRDSLVRNYTVHQLTGIACEFTLKLPINLCF
ncbi:hypothetical protein [Pontibacter sp. H249]|uniref:hypothetical protein n=1 Tax=Pontibacter sp. H249 TaxID=3133420 RepID=UPI0030C54C56